MQFFISIGIFFAGLGVLFIGSALFWWVSIYEKIHLPKKPKEQ
ncbi:hypothetical protein [Sporosalibacterium faouarense]|nr:hypothetical protein [Sporosalibacterium faouarense]